MKAKILGVAGAIAVACIGACFVAPGRVDSTGASNAALDCAAGERGFNGACRAICSETLPCAGGSVCAGIDADVAVCLEPSVTCSYLGSDTVCASRGGFYGSSGRGRGATQFIPYSSYPYGAAIDEGALTSDHDAYFQPYGYGGYSGYGSNGLGCQGNARWQPAPLAGSVACRGRHSVDRCRLVGGYSCTLVGGTTEEVVLPAP